MILGLRDDVAAALRAIIIAQGTAGICPASAAPPVAFAYISGVDYAAPGVFGSRPSRPSRQAFH
jgi:hypothetical protein